MPLLLAQELRLAEEQGVALGVMECVAQLLAEGEPEAV